MNTPLCSECLAVQNPLVGYAEKIGRAYLPPEQAFNSRRDRPGEAQAEALHAQET